MAIAETRYKHIVLNEKRVPIITGTNMKVIELVLERMAYGWSSEELHFQHPYLTLGQIHSALAYYCDHQEELDSDIENRLKNIKEIQIQNISTPLKDRLKTKGLI
jgi:uncharacterized protein (DUF433 family)